MQQSIQQDRTVKFWDRISKSYESKPIADLEVYERKLAVTREYLTTDTRLLEVGCGTGKTAVVHAPYVKSVVGTDFSGQMIEFARAQVENSTLSNVEFKVENAMRSLESGQFDAIMAMSVIHLVEDPKKFVQQVRSALSPGGVFISSTVCLSDIASFLKPVAAAGRMVGLLPRLSFFSVREFIEMMRDVGFTIEYEWQPKKGSCFIVARAQ